MNVTMILTLLIALAGDEPETAGAQRERLFRLHLGDALEYTMYRDVSQKEKLDFRKEPVYVWTNPVRTSQQDGVVFIWTSRGRPEAIGTIFSSAAGGKRGVNHEFHSLSLSTLDITRRGTHEHLWKPRAAGIELTPIEGAPSPAGSAAPRLAADRAQWPACSPRPRAMPRTIAGTSASSRSPSTAMRARTLMFSTEHFSRS